MAYPSATVELRDSLACDHFMDALNDADLHIAVRQGRPASLPQALASAVEIEAVRRTAGVSVQSPPSAVLIRQGQGPRQPRDAAAVGPATPEVLQGILRALNELQQSLAGSARPGPGGSLHGTGRRGAGPGACWECGTVGHFRRHCPRGAGNPAGPGQNRRQGNEQ